MSQLQKEKQPQNLKIYTTLSILTLLFGIALLIYMVTVEDEPGALPLFLILTGTGGYLYLRSKLRKQMK